MIVRLADARPGLQVVWFKRDLRVHDHRPLWEASQRGPVLALYVYEHVLIHAPDFDPRHQVFIDESLAELEAALAARGGRLCYRMDTPEAVLEHIHRRWGIATLWAHQETGNAVSYARDLQVHAWARSRGVPFVELIHNGVVRRLRTRDGWSRRWHQRMARPVWPAPATLALPEAVRTGAFPTERRRTLTELGLSASTAVLAQPGGEDAGQRALQSFLAHRGETYRSAMSSPLGGWQTCARVSPHLTWGTLSVRQCHHAQRARRAALEHDTQLSPSSRRALRDSLISFEKRLSWHCHFMQKLEDEPALEDTNLCRAYDGLREADFSEEHMQAWAAGHTGFPLIDACMRALHATGWINFRMRAMLVSFAAYHLWLHWQPPALHLARLFTDYEPGIHYCQLQMQSGTTGINTVRVYSPSKQAREQDPTGRFIRRWLPALAGVPTEWLAEPWQMPGDVQQRVGCRIGRDYPAPIVDDRAAVAAAKARIYAVRGRWETRTQAHAVYVKHGSRKQPPSQREAIGRARGNDRSGARSRTRRAETHVAEPAPAAPQLSLFDPPAPRG